jgi:hypothetical protein
MRLGLLGPVHDSDKALERAAQFLLREIAVDRAVYLGVDQSLDRLVRHWATELVGGDPTDDALWERAAERCVRALPEEIDQFIEAERERQSLKVFESLPGDGTRLIELLNGRVAVMIYDKADLDEEDMLPASFLVFGASRQPLVKRVGSRWFLSPGVLGHFGVMTLEDREDGVHLQQFDSLCREVRRERLTSERTARLHVSGRNGC